MDFAPTTYRAERVRATAGVEEDLLRADDLENLTPELLRGHPSVITTLRMSTAPPIARDRLTGLAGVSRGLVQTLEKGQLPRAMKPSDLSDCLDRITSVVVRLLDRDIFPWLADGRKPTDHERTRASTIVADRRCGAAADPIVRNAQEQRQLALIEAYLVARGYLRKSHPPARPLKEMEAGTFAHRMNVVVGSDRKVNIPIDVVIQPKDARGPRLPLLIEAKSAGDYTNTNKRRKEEATKLRQLRDTYGQDVQLVLFLCGYFDSGYLGYEAAEGLDWVWEHRIEDLKAFGI